MTFEGADFSGCDSLGCDWTTCVSSDSFNTALLNNLEQEFCIDVTREYATGQSNGAIYTFHLGTSADLGGRLAAIAPVSGSMMNGYITGPPVPLPVLDVTGTSDVTVPINDTTYGNGAVSNEGWIYSTMDDIFAVWEPANGCESSETSAHFPTSLDGVQDLYCWGKQCQGNPVVRCAWDGGHNYYGNNGTLNSALVWEFLSSFSRPSHMGMGIIETPEGKVHSLPRQSYLIPDPFADGMKHRDNPSFPRRKLGVKKDNDAESEKRQPSPSSRSDFHHHHHHKHHDHPPPPPHHHHGDDHYYGDPRRHGGCRQDEKILFFTDGKFKGSSCAPTIEVGSCIVGGYRTTSNGCPDHKTSSGNNESRDGVFPTCLALSDDATTSVGDEFHCLLACDRTNSSTIGKFKSGAMKKRKMGTIIIPPVYQRYYYCDHHH